MTHRISDLEDLPDAPGGYALMVRLTAPLGLSRRRWRGATLHPGLYVYCGGQAALAPAFAAMRGHRRCVTGTWMS